MIDSRVLQLLLTLVFIALLGFITYKITLPICLKIIDLCLKFPLFNNLVAILLSVFFGATGVFQLKGFIAETGPYLSRFFPLSFFASVMFLFLGFWNYKHTK